MTSRTILVIIFILVAQAILFLGHWFLYKTAIRFFSISQPGVISLMRYVFAGLAIIFILVSVLAFFTTNWLARIIYMMGTAWLGIFFYLLMAGILMWFIYGLMKIFGLPFDFKLLAGILFGLALAISVYGIINANIVQVKSLNLELANLPSHWQGKKAIWVSDTHLGLVRNFGTAKKIAAMIKELQPDILFIGGDLYDGVAADLDKLAQPFGQINPPKGTYFITGNHEEFGDNTKYLDAVKRAGIKVLNNELVNIHGLQIIGVDYRDAGDKEQLEKILKQVGLNPEQPSILLKHAPFDIPVAQEAGISLQLSGHTHQGQIFPLNFITQRVYQGFDFGFKKLGDFIIYTSTGAGTWGPPLRVGNKPEIVLVTLK